MTMEALTPSLGYGGAGINDRLPKILAELQGQNVTLVTGGTAGSALACGSIDHEDTIQSVIRFASGVPSDVTSEASIVDRRASGTITVLTTVVDGDTVTVNGKVYTFKQIVVTPSTNLAPYVVPINVGPSGIDPGATALALSIAIMSGDSTITCTVNSTVVTVICRLPGVAGNSDTLATSSAHCTVSGAGTLAGGSATSAIKLSTTNTTGNILQVFWYDKWAGIAEATISDAGQF